MNIKDLVKKYQSNRDAYLQADYNETQLRTDFLDPLFELLDWDIKNANGKPTNEREVLVEEGLKADATSNTKKPDYTFRLFSERKYFLEAKKPNVKIESDNEPAKQVRRYGFTAKLKISVLSNFEYLAIYDCSRKVEKDDSVTNSRINIYHYTEYESAFDDIKNQLGKQSVYSGEFDEAWKEIEEQLKLSSVDDLFLAQINEWRIVLGKQIYSHKPELSIDELNDIVQSYINSIIFLRVCEDRNLEAYKTLLSLAENNDFATLIKKFKEADKKYNAGLFNQPLTDKVISDSSSAFWEMIKDLYFPESTYSFSVFASDILGNIYEIFLGEQLVLENGEISLKKKPENIDRDIVTTPIFIIQDILRQTVIEHCNNKTDKEILGSTFADIACGSGAFLLETYQLLQDILIDYFLINDKTKLVQTSINTYKLGFESKKAILENCIWGVDKDYNAVQACKFGLLLKLLENESNESVTIPALPNIDQNIQFGNSLIDTSISTDEKVNPFDFGETKFNVIVGNPPYMATEHMKQLLPDEKPLYEKHYVTAHKQYDKYFLFIERGLYLLKDNGYFGYIIPSKFTKVGAGVKLRELLAEKKVIKKIISFGANQIFQDKTTYTSILILSKTNNTSFSNTEVKNLNEWKIRDFESITSEEVGVATLSSDLWFLIPPYLKETYNSILKQSANLEDVIGINNINNGIQTSANDVLVLKPSKEDDAFVYFEKNDISYKIEKGIIKPYYETIRKRNGIKLNTYRILKPNTYVIFPYLFENNKTKFIYLDELEENYPEAHKYLTDDKIKHRLIYQKNSTKLRSIEPKPKTEDEWYRFGRSQYLELGAIKEKIIIGVMSSGEKYPIDFSKTLHTAGGTAGYCSIYLADDSPYSIYYIQAVLNSRYVEWLIHLRGEIFSGGYIARGTKILKKIPIRTIDFKNEDDKAIHDKIVTLQMELVSIQGRIDYHTGNPRKLFPLVRRFRTKKSEMAKTLKVLYNLGDSDSLIPTISEMYAVN